MKDRVTGAKPWTNSTIPRETAAGTLDATASTLHTRGDQISGAAHSAANKIHATANYLRQANVKGMVDGIEVTLRRRL
jgi:hypothetical protein